ncbi:hypothetical protein J3E72DRAFT_405656 [Bipolaris maydis]|uniref:uncharacterized protein n=1 Tax=Cochliobolus heterostrophus TaxID=5016 RepID=UPI0024D40EA5|nr:hypothetical protein BM1_07444 [Bipolaris maydis]KAJ5023326.1 hypothetical protein J3E73DRAFT_400829 [Bipolaris maydis]KAJ5041470.1 hypothetical protein J3E74DRAFT_450143 [Bipolaris maydis]KAJ5055921.1 hypothetical protein J3E74DRAFT_440687 [Bipolaris maydis]KAJ6193675.1 hypothetical protein J3E72DRAFT_405656 [Bipolaris maydis]
MPTTRATTLAMSEDMEEAARPRPSRFKEHTNTNSTIRPPPEELWKDVAIDDLIEQYNEDNAQPPVSRKTSANHAARTARPAPARTNSGSSNSDRSRESSAPAQANSASGPGEGTYARIQRAFASMFGSVLGKRKAGSMDAERDREQQLHQQLLDERKKAAEIAYYEAKDRGLLPTPKVFVRPAMAARANLQNAEKMQLGLTTELVEAATPMRIPGTPRTPGLHHTPSKKDLQKQKKLSKRVSDLEFKLASARKELHTVLYNDLPPAPPVPKFAPPTPDVTQSENEPASPEARTSTSSNNATAPRSMGRILKKRKTTAAAHDSDTDYKPLPTDSEGDTDMLSVPSASEYEAEHDNDNDDDDEPSTKHAKSSASRKKNKNSKRQSSRLRNKFSRSSFKQDKPVCVVPDGVNVPDVPSLPQDVQDEVKSRARKGGRDDGYGGLGHEIF